MSEIVTTYATMISPAGGRLQAMPVARTDEQVSAMSGVWAISRPGSREVQPAVPGMKEQLMGKEDKEKREPDRQQERESQWRRMDGILFAYNFRGDLRIKYMDSVNKLVYQTPPVLLAKLSDLMAVTTPVDVTV